MYSTLFDLVSLSVFDKLLNIAESNSMECWGKQIERHKIELEKLLEKQHLDKLKYFRHALECKMIDITLEMCDKMLSLGVKIGMELNDSFRKLKNDEL